MQSAIKEHEAMDIAKAKKDGTNTEEKDANIFPKTGEKHDRSEAQSAFTNTKEKDVEIDPKTGEKRNRS